MPDLLKVITDDEFADMIYRALRYASVTDCYYDAYDRGLFITGAYDFEALAKNLRARIAGELDDTNDGLHVVDYCDEWKHPGKELSSFAIESFTFVEATWTQSRSGWIGSSSVIFLWRPSKRRLSSTCLFHISQAVLQSLVLRP